LRRAEEKRRRLHSALRFLTFHPCARRKREKGRAEGGTTSVSLTNANIVGRKRREKRKRNAKEGPLHSLFERRGKKRKEGREGERRGIERSSLPPLFVRCSA